MTRTIPFYLVCLFVLFAFVAAGRTCPPPEEAWQIYRERVLTSGVPVDIPVTGESVGLGSRVIKLSDDLCQGLIVFEEEQSFPLGIVYTRDLGTIVLGIAASENSSVQQFVREEIEEMMDSILRPELSTTNETTADASGALSTVVVKKFDALFNMAPFRLECGEKGKRAVCFLKAKDKDDLNLLKRIQDQCRKGDIKEVAFFFKPGDELSAKAAMVVLYMAESGKFANDLIFRGLFLYLDPSAGEKRFWKVAERITKQQCKNRSIDLCFRQRIALSLLTVRGIGASFGGCIFE